MNKWIKTILKTLAEIQFANQNIHPLHMWNSMTFNKVRELYTIFTILE